MPNEETLTLIFEVADPTEDSWVEEANETLHNVVEQLQNEGNGIADEEEVRIAQPNSRGFISGSLLKMSAGLLIPFLTRIVLAILIKSDRPEIITLSSGDKKIEIVFRDNTDIILDKIGELVKYYIDHKESHISVIKK